MTSARGFVKTETVMQIEAVECGAACLAMVLRHFGQQVTLEQMRKETDVSRNGCNAGSICRAAEARGLESQGYRRDADALSDMSLPCIIWWERNHFVVFEGYRNNAFCINDPAFGRRRISEEDFRQSYSGIVLEFQPKESFKEQPDYVQKPQGRDRIGLMDARSGDEKRKLAMLCAASILSGACGVAVAFLICRTAGGSGMWVAIGLLLAAMLALEFFSIRRKQKTETGIELHSSHQLLQMLFFMPASFFEQRHPSDMVARVRKNDGLSRFTADGYISSIADAAVAALCLIALMTIQLNAAVAAIVTALLGIGLRAVEFAAGKQIKTKIAIETAQVSRTIYTGLRRTDSIINSGYGDAYAKKAADCYRSEQASELKLHRLQSASSHARQIVYAAFACLLFLLYTGISSAYPEFIAVLILSAMLLTRTEKAAAVWQYADRLYWDKKVVDETKQYSEKSSISRAEAGPDFNKLQGNITIDDVTFSYMRYGEPVIKDVSLDIASGSVIGVTGGTGSGKSTLGKLISGMREPTDGTISYDGRSLANVPRRVFTASIATVPQKPVLFTGTIRDNIAMWNDNISDDAIDRAAEDACIKDVIASREGGYSYEIGDRGRGFSGGEQQRIEIARALAVDPSVLILDEGTSGLDDASARTVINNIRRRGCTTIFITQKKFILDMCDKVIDLDAGEGAAI